MGRRFLLMDYYVQGDQNECQRMVFVGTFHPRAKGVNMVAVKKTLAR